MNHSLEKFFYNKKPRTLKKSYQNARCIYKFLFFYKEGQLNWRSMRESKQ